ncbi:UDP-N-acetylmuramoyl-L-alanine--D-glutamate ligase [Sulfurihydrogenibium subterraneum]|uniref:UDP-N-acetylmuramoyl-L-alanine--D-glutamate ligase n=1 Tax=Sulfurihydrogenibium subterraneum TaxID=171121 RepID=UPI000490EED9|nr:UDP-N-acetylmuramoyl-L-alanine--D-glutamate ligase [Sulfurihydrogenibium subterraneum]
MILIYGKGKTGLAVKKFLDEKKIENVIIDDQDSLTNLNPQLIIVSPGIPFYHRIYKFARKNKIPIISDVEYACSFFKGDIIGITGTDGKTTTTSLVYEIFKNLSGKSVFVGGNYGVPFIEADNKTEIAVLELSSFQLYSTKRFKPKIAVILNISKDHLDWHKKMKHYILSKFKIFKNQQEEDYLVLNYDDNCLRQVKAKSQIYYFSLNQLPEDKKGIYLKGIEGSREYRLVLQEKEKIEFKVKTLLVGLHNLQNVMASLLVSYLYGLDLDSVLKVIQEFKPLPHRIEFVSSINGISFYNDSKATTVQAVEKAIDSFDKNVILILGGINKGGDFSALSDKLKQKVKKAIIIGRDKEQIKSMIENYTQVELADSLEDAVIKSYNNAEKGDTVILSPGCASFDMFKSYADRGNQYISIVKSLESKNG